MKGKLTAKDKPRDHDDVLEGALRREKELAEEAPNAMPDKLKLTEVLRAELVRTIQFADTPALKAFWAFALRKGYAIDDDTEVDPVLREIKAAKVPFWIDRGENYAGNPAKFIRLHYARWRRSKRLRPDLIFKYDPLLADAYRKWIKRHPQDQIAMAPSRRRLDRRAVTDQGWVPASQLSTDQLQARNRKVQDHRAVEPLVRVRFG